MTSKGTKLQRSYIKTNGSHSITQALARNISNTRKISPIHAQIHQISAQIHRIHAQIHRIRA